MTHNIKIRLQYADAIIDGRKTFEVRKNDRGYNAGDKVKFDVISDDGELTMYHYPLHPLNNAVYEITYVHSGLGLEKDYVVFGLKPIEEEKESLSQPIEINCLNCKRNCQIFPSDGVCNRPEYYEPKCNE